MTVNTSLKSRKNRFRETYLTKVGRFDEDLQADRFRPEHLSLKVPNIKFDFDVSVDSRHCLTDTLMSNLTLGTHLHAMIRTHHFDFDIRF